MLIKTHKVIKNISTLPRFVKLWITLLIDLNLCILSAWLAFYLRLDQFILIKGAVLTAASLSVLLCLPVFWLLGFYRTIFKDSDLTIIFDAFTAIFLYGFLYFLVITVYGVTGIPRSIGIIQPMLLFFGIVTSRLFIRYLLDGNYFFQDKSKFLKKVLVYGAGSAGRQLVSALENSHELKVVGLLDDDPQLHGQISQGQKFTHR